VHRDYPTRVNITFQQKDGQVVLDQIRTVDKSRLVKRLGRLPEEQARQVAALFVRMFSY
jgi:mRNA interferase MazF